MYIYLTYMRQYRKEIHQQSFRCKKIIFFGKNALFKSFFTKWSSDFCCGLSYQDPYWLNHYFEIMIDILIQKWWKYAYLFQSKVDIILYFKVQGVWYVWDSTYCPINDKCQQKVKEQKQKHLCFVLEGYHEPNCVKKKIFKFANLIC